MAIDEQNPESVNQEALKTQQEAPRNEQEGHFAKLRKKTEALEQALHDRDQMLHKQQQELDQLQQRFQPQERDEFESLSDDELIDKARMKKVLEKERHKILKEAENVARQTYQKINSENFQQRIYQSYPDYDQVVNESGAEVLREKDPEFFAVLSKIGDEYERREFAYKKIKRLTQQEEKPRGKIQDVVNENRQAAGAYYTPGGQSGMMANFEFNPNDPASKKAAYQRLKSAQKRPFNPQK